MLREVFLVVFLRRVERSRGPDRRRDGLLQATRVDELLLRLLREAPLVLVARAAGPLGSIKDFMSAHNSAIMMILLLVLGAKLLGQGVGALGG